jgi:CHAT domain
MALIALMLTGGDSARLNEIRMRFEHAWPYWRRAPDMIPLVEVISHDEDFPFGLMPLLDWDNVARFENYAEAEYALRRFVGFSMAVRHTKGEKVTGADLQARPLRVQLITYEDPKIGSALERGFFQELPEVVEVEGPWPGAGLDPEIVAEHLFDALYDPVRTLSGAAHTGLPVQIQHFACHCTTFNQADTSYTLTLGSEKQAYQITLGAIQWAFLSRLRSSPAATGPRPLVIANACGSAKVDKESGMSFQKYFLKNGHRGFLGTEIEVPGEIAAHFANFLYQELLAGRPFGEAVVRSRWRLLAERGSPLGLLYTMYGDPLLAVADSP